MRQVTGPDGAEEWGTMKTRIGLRRKARFPAAVRALAGALALIFAGTQLGGVAHAHRRGDKEDKEKAAAHYKEGKKLFDLGKFAEAISEWEKGYAAKEDKAFLINLGHAHREMGNFDKAIFYYKRYLVGIDDNAPQRAAVLEYISVLEAKRVEAQRKAEEEAKAREARNNPPPDLTVKKEPKESTVPPPPPPPAEGGVVTKWWFWTGVAVVIGGGVATALLVSGGGSGKDFTQPPAGLPAGNVIRF